MRFFYFMICLIIGSESVSAQLQPVRLSEVPTFGKLESFQDSLRIYVYAMDFVERGRIIKELEKDLYVKVVDSREESDIILGFLSSSRPLNMRLDLWSSVLAGTYGQKLSGTRSLLADKTYGAMAAFTWNNKTEDLKIYWYAHKKASNPAKDCTRMLLKTWGTIIKTRASGMASGGAR